MKNKQFKNEIIEYLVKDYYSKFKELNEIWNEDILKKKLNKNIKKVITNKKSAIYLGRYYIINKKIVIYNKSINNKKLVLRDIQENLKLKTTILHEVTHALFRRNIVTTGSFTINFGISMFKNYPRNIVKCRGLNEGITNWIVEKCGLKINTYKIETNTIKQLEICLGTKEILNVSIIKTKDIPKSLGISKQEFKKICTMLDNINFIDLKLIKKMRYVNKLIGTKFKYANKQNLTFKEKIILFLNLYNLNKIDKSVAKVNNKISRLREKRKNNAIDLQEFIYEKYIKNFIKDNNNDLLKLYTIMLEYKKCVGDDTKIKVLDDIKNIIDIRGKLDGNVN